MRHTVLLLVLCGCQQGAETPVAVQAAPQDLPVSAQPAPRLEIALSEDDLAAGRLVTQVSLEGLDDLLVRVHFTAEPPIGAELVLELYAPAGGFLQAYTQVVAGHDVVFDVPIGGTVIERRGLTGSLGMIASLGEGTQALASAAIELTGEVSP
jgi:hypothetical protein